MVRSRPVVGVVEQVLTTGEGELVAVGSSSKRVVDAEDSGRLGSRRPGGVVGDSESEGTGGAQDSGRVEGMGGDVVASEEAPGQDGGLGQAAGWSVFALVAEPDAIHGIPTILTQSAGLYTRNQSEGRRRYPTTTYVGGKGGWWVAQELDFHVRETLS